MCSPGCSTIKHTGGVQPGGGVGGAGGPGARAKQALGQRAAPSRVKARQGGAIAVARGGAGSAQAVDGGKEYVVVRQGVRL